MKMILEDMSSDELLEELKSLSEELEDFEETFEFNLTHTSAHISGGAVSEHEEELNKLRERIGRIKSMLQKREG
jgi:hypothetical protein